MSDEAGVVSSSTPVRKKLFGVGEARSSQPALGTQDCIDGKIGSADYLFGDRY